MTANWRKIIGWTTVGIGALLLFAIAAGILLLNTSAFRHFLISKIESAAQENLGARVELQNLTLHLKTLTADVYGVTVHGTEPEGEKPLLLVPHARLVLKITSIFRRRVNLNELLVDSPAVNLIVTKSGRSNLPQPPKKNNQSNTNVFDLAVGHVLLRNGEIQLRDRRIPMNFEITDLRTEIRFNEIARKYSGTLSYNNARLQYGHMSPLPSRVEARFDASPSELNLNPLVFSLGASRIRLEARVRDYSSAPEGSGRYDVLLHTQDFAGLSGVARASGNVALTGTVAYHDVPNRPLLRNVVVNGSLTSKGLLVDSPQANLPIARIGGQYQLANGTLKAHDLVMELLEGQLAADATIEGIDRSPRSRAHVTLSGVSLQSLKSALQAYSNKEVPVTGVLNADADVAWNGGFRNLTAKGRILVDGRVLASARSRPRSFPLNADIRAIYDGHKDQITVPASLIQLPATSITAEGKLGGRSNLVIKAGTRDIQQLMVLVNGINAGRTGQPASGRMTVQGAATLTATVRGTLHSPQINAQLAANQLRVNQSEWRSLQLQLVASPSQVAIQNGSLASARQGKISFSGQAGLNRWRYEASAPIAATLRVQQLPITEVQELAGSKYPVEGVLAADMRLGGSALNPEGNGQLRLTSARAYNERLQNFSTEFTAAGGMIRANLNAAIPAGTLSASLNYAPRTQAYDLKLSAPDIALGKLHAVQAKNIGVEGTLSLSAGGAGTLKDPQLTAELQLPELQLRGTRATNVRANLAVANHLARISLSSGVDQATIRGNGTVKLSPGYYVEAALDTSKFPLDPLLAVYAPARPAGLHGETELHASVRGPLADRSKLEAHLTIPTLQFEFQKLQLANASPIRVDYRDSIVTLQPVDFRGTDTSLQLHGRIPLLSSERINFSAKGSVNARLAQMFSPGLYSRGTVLLDLTANGTRSNPGLNGQIRVQDVSLNTPASPLGLEHFNANLQITDTGVQITNAAGQLGGGQITLGGSVLYRPQLQMNLTVSTRDVRLRYPEGMRTEFTSDLTLTGDRQASLLQGQVLIDSLSFTSDFDAATFMGQFTGTSAPASPNSLLQNLKLQISIQTSNQLNAGTSQLNIEGQANLRVIGTGAEPVIVGRADLTAGEIFFNKQQYHLERGIINFVNPNQTEPVLNTLITARTNQYDLSITIVGPINRLRITYTSDPPLPPADVINLIARGQTTQEGPTSFGANTVLAAGLGQVGGGLSKLTGISGLQIDPLMGGNNTNPSARLGLQKRVTRNFTFTFSTDVTQPQNEIVQGEYQLTKRWSVSVVRNESGGFAVDGRFHTNF